MVRCGCGVVSDVWCVAAGARGVYSAVGRVWWMGCVVCGTG